MYELWTHSQSVLCLCQCIEWKQKHLIPMECGHRSHATNAEHWSDGHWSLLKIPRTFDPIIIIIIVQLLMQKKKNNSKFRARNQKIRISQFRHSKRHFICNNTCVLVCLDEKCLRYRIAVNWIQVGSRPSQSHNPSFIYYSRILFLHWKWQLVQFIISILVLFSLRARIYWIVYSMTWQCIAKCYHTKKLNDNK